MLEGNSTYMHYQSLRTREIKSLVALVNRVACLKKHCSGKVARYAASIAVCALTILNIFVEDSDHDKSNSKGPDLSELKRQTSKMMQSANALSTK